MNKNSIFSISVEKKHIFIDTSINLIPGHHYGLVGRNGIGKSVLLRHIATFKIPIPNETDIFYLEQEIEPSELSVFQSIISANVTRTKLLEKYQALEAIIDQEENPSDTIFDEYQEIQEELDAIGADKDESIVRKLLVGLGFPTSLHDLPTNDFSGGWRMRIALAKALYLKPSLLLLDEPTNHLDLEANIWLTEYMKTYPKTFLIASHNQNFLNQVCTDIYHIHNYKLDHYRGNYDKFCYSYHNKRRKQIKDWDKLMKDVKNMQKKSKPKKEMEEHIEKSGLTEPEREYQVKIQFNPAKEIKGSILELSDITFGYTPDKILFQDLNFEMNLYSRICLVGPNGVGKSTFINLLVGNLDPLNGNIFRNSGLKIGYYNQHFINYLPMDVTPIHYLLSFDPNYQPDEKLDKRDPRIQEVRKQLGINGLDGKLHNILIKELSGGQKARVAFSALNFQKSHLLLLDEPTNHLDIEAINALIEAINQFNGGVLIISHDMELITRTNCQLWTLDQQILESYDGDYQDYRDEILAEIEQE